jgi:tetratricopeptide (TPR) repeat protein
MNSLPSLSSVTIGTIVALVASHQPAVALSREAIAQIVRSETVETVDEAEALTEYDRAIQLHPNDAKVYYNRGLARSKFGDKKGAISDYDRAIRMNPNDARAYTNRGATRSDLGNREGAISDANQAIRINPNLANAYVIRGLARGRSGDRQGGLSDLQKAAGLAQQQKNQSLYGKIQTVLNHVKP